MPTLCLISSILTQMPQPLLQELSQHYLLFKQDSQPQQLARILPLHLALLRLLRLRTMLHFTSNLTQSFIREHQWGARLMECLELSII